MKTLDQVLEVLKSITPENAAQVVESVTGELRNLIFEERTHAHNMAREQMHKTIKQQLASLAPDEFADLDKVKWEHMIPMIGEKLKIAESGAKKSEKKTPETSETSDQIRARLESEYAKRLDEERKALAISSAFEKIEAAAIAKKLDPAYKSIFRAALASDVEAELVDNKAVFKSKADGKYFVRDGQHAEAEYVAEELLKRYPRLTAQQTHSPQPPQVNGFAIDKLSAGLSELKIFQH